MRAVLCLALFLPGLITGAVLYETVENEATADLDEPRAVPGNYSVSFVPLITLIANVIPRLMNRFRPTTTSTTTARSSRDHFNSTEFHGAHPCLDNILTRKPFPGNECYFYECELHEPATPACSIKVIPDFKAMPEVNPMTVTADTLVLKVDECLDIRLYRCAPGYSYEVEAKNCFPRRDHHTLMNCLTV